MNWTDLPCNILLKRIFTTPPKIGKIDIFEIEIKRDGPLIIINFDLVGELPDKPPEKWGKEFNHCRLGIHCMEISNLSMRGLATTMIANIKIERDDDATSVVITGSEMTMSFQCKHISVTGPSVYLSH